MSLPVWPATLPPLVSLTDGGGSDSLVPSILETEMDDGPARARRKKLYTETPIQVSLMLTHAQMLAFQQFLRDTLGHGASRFTADVRVADAVLLNRVCRISGGKVAMTDIAVARRVSFTLIVRDW